MIGAWIDGRTARAAQTNPGDSSEGAPVGLRLSEDTDLQVVHDVRYVERMPSARHPQLVYWFWHPNTLADSQYLNDVESMAEKSSFTMAIMTSRENIDPPGMGVDFYDFERMHEPFAQVVRAAHEHNLKIGMQVWEFWALTRINDPITKLRPRLPIEQSLALVTEGEVLLDAHGHANYSVTSTEGRDRDPFHSEVLKVWAFRKTAEGYYAEDSLVDITASVKTMKADPSSASLSIDALAHCAGYTAYVLVAHYYDYPDLFNDVMTDTFRNMLEHYADIPLDGTALDEFGYMMLKPKRDGPFRDRFYGRAFAAEYKRRTGMALDRVLFDMRFAPQGKPEVRIRAINLYFDVMREGPLRVERAFCKMSKAIFGPKTFAGIHNTYHNGLESDDLWRVGLNWWTVPREYGQSDENWGMPERMGLIMAHSEPVTFDQYYGGKLEAFLQKAFREPRFGGRTHYLAWNDTRVGRINMTDAIENGKYAAIEEVEQKIRLLNQFDPPAPRLPLLVVFGMPALINWFPNYEARSAWDIHGKLDIQGKALEVWKAGYPCALLPSDFIDNGEITFDAAGHPMIHGHRFDCMVYLYPQYAKRATLEFLDRFTQHGGKLMLEGDATHDFEGRDITAWFDKIAARATIRGFDVQQIVGLGVHTNPLDDKAFMEDGSVVFTDFDSWQAKHAKPFAITMAGHEFSGSFVGVCALKVDTLGTVEKFVCGGFSELLRDREPIFSLEHPADAVVTRNSDGRFHAWLQAPTARSSTCTRNTTFDQI
jgi:hypothetical protein